MAEYAVCARRHYYLSVLSLEEMPPRAKVPPVGAMRAASRGNLVHRVLEEIAFDADEEAVRTHLRRLVGGDAEELAALGKDILAFLQGPTGYELRQARQVGREVPLHLTLQDVDGWTLQVSGVADLIYQDADSEWHIIDYKQSRLGKGKLPMYRYQLSVYALALMQAFELPQVHIGLRFLEDRSPPPKDHLVSALEAMRLQQTILKLGRQLALSSRVLVEDAWPRVEQEQRCHDLECGFRWRCGRMPVPKQQLELALDF
jgi:CRISPR/Cas system-associated exonuclease Cas4 (RecB family)